MSAPLRRMVTSVTGVRKYRVSSLRMLFRRWATYWEPQADEVAPAGHLVRDVRAQLKEHARARLRALKPRQVITAGIAPSSAAIGREVPPPTETP